MSVCVAAEDYPPSVGELVARAKAQVKTIDLAAFKAAFDKGEAGLIVDVREPAEFAIKHIPGAVNIPRGVIEMAIWRYVGFPEATDMKARISLYCGSGSRCALAAKSLQDLGFVNVAAVDMKLADWEKAGFPLTPRD
jgi:rhodanese-related sulfurtransferase